MNSLDGLELILAEIDDSDFPDMSLSQLATIVGVQPNDEGRYSRNEMINALLAIQDKPGYRALSSEQRIRTLRVVDVAMTALIRGAGGIDIKD